MNCLPDSPTELAQDYVLQGAKSDTLIIFAHGAGANMHHEFMVNMSDKLVKNGFQVYRFNFLYMQANMQDGKRRPPDRAPKLLTHLEQVLIDVGEKIKQGLINPKRIVLIGKSMGGRMSAILTSAEHVFLSAQAKDIAAKIAAVVCLGYPFIPLKGGEPRLSPIQTNPLPILIVQGERDKFGGREQVPSWPLSENTSIYWIGDGDHSLQPRKSSGYTLEGNLQQASDGISQFIASVRV
ncbi:alpha/beta fold hydrolase [Shewanella saliphila]|uniref:Dienelactone hydrolase n=1 Tax=Shewanella saliphila TaxID=2282698 RepID=A0ABQ2Q7J2_9GAMM|nr:alpha/beta family hydrolase [Shewanella saliphila]MCL1101843.1 dienelactone hydrolase family protein [Shewanella saliphila]GGP59418.1 dienelactone hydrolase [Shewanella saliphila]